MASSITTEKFTANNAARSYSHDPDGTSATVLTPDGGTTSVWLDMKDFTEFTVIAAPSALTGDGITKVEIVAADDTSGTNITVIKDSGTVAADALNDQVVQSCVVQEIAELSENSGYSLRYVSARITVQNTADEAVVTAIRSGALHAESGLTATTIA